MKLSSLICFLLFSLLSLVLDCLYLTLEIAHPELSETTETYIEIIQEKFTPNRKRCCNVGLNLLSRPVENSVARRC